MGSDEDSLEVLAKEMEEMVKASPAYSPGRCIYRIPRLLRQANEEAFTPALVSIGPLHHKSIIINNVVLDMEPHKLNYLRSFLESTSNNASLRQYLERVKTQEARIRECYAEDFTCRLDSQELVKMVLTDSAFIIELLRKASSPAEEGVEDDLIWGHPHLLNEVLRDIMLAENQLPFFIIADLYQAGFGSRNTSIHVIVSDFLCSYFRTSTSYESKPSSSTPNKLYDCCHLLDLLRNHYKCTGHDNIRIHSTQLDAEEDWMPVSLTAAKLYEANVRFDSKVVDQHSCSLLDIKFEASGKLRIPKLTVGGRTESLFRNLIAFEQCHYPDNPFVTDYVFFMGCLINTPEDVQVLVNANVIENLLGSNENMSSLFNTLCKNVYVVPHQYCYQDTTQQLIRHYTKPWNHYRAVLKHRHLTRPWTVILLVYAILLLSLTFAQVVMSIMDTLPLAIKRR